MFNDIPELSNFSGNIELKIEKYPLIPGYKWKGKWQKYLSNETDNEGWCYGKDLI